MGPLLERGLVEDRDPAPAGRPDHAVRAQRAKRTHDDFACGAEFLGHLELCPAECERRGAGHAPPFEQERGEPALDALPGVAVESAHDLAHTTGQAAQQLERKVGVSANGIRDRVRRAA